MYEYELMEKASAKLSWVIIIQIIMVIIILMK